MRVLYFDVNKWKYLVEVSPEEMAVLVEEQFYPPLEGIPAGTEIEITLHAGHVECIDTRE